LCYCEPNRARFSSPSCHSIEVAILGELRDRWEGVSTGQQDHLVAFRDEYDATVRIEGGTWTRACGTSIKVPLCPTHTNSGTAVDGAGPLGLLWRRNLQPCQIAKSSSVQERPSSRRSTAHRSRDRASSPAGRPTSKLQLALTAKSMRCACEVTVFLGVKVFFF